MAQIIKIEEFEQEGNIYIREYYDRGHIVERLKPQEITEPIEQPTYEPTEQELIQAEILLALAKQQNQLNEIQSKLNQQGV